MCRVKNNEPPKNNVIKALILLKMCKQWLINSAYFVSASSIIFSVNKTCFR